MLHQRITIEEISVDPEADPSPIREGEILGVIPAARLLAAFQRATPMSAPLASMPEEIRGEDHGDFF